MLNIEYVQNRQFKTLNICEGKVLISWLPFDVTGLLGSLEKRCKTNLCDRPAAGIIGL